MNKYNLLKISILSITFLCLCFLIIFPYDFKVNSSSPIHKYTVVIDAGHGGIDGGVVGYNGTIESEINLQIAKQLGNLFVSSDFNVVYTRSDSNGLYSEDSKNKKIDDMKKRIQIVEKSNADIVISIHQNGYTLENQRGIMVFYKKGQDASKDLAELMQTNFIKNFEFARKEALVGDYFILNECKSLCVLVECGFLTNIEEEQLLNNPNHQSKICFSIFSSCVQFFVKKGDLCLEN